MSVGEQLREMWRQARGAGQDGRGREAQVAEIESAELRDYAFMPGQDPTLALRGSQANLTLLRASASDRFYIRMYDGSTPPNYSEFSTALFINLPLSG